MTQEIKSKKAWYKKWWVWVIVVFFIAAISSMDNDKSSQTTTTQTGTSAITVGQQGFLRIPNNNSPDQVIILTGDKEDYKQVTKSLLANDMIGVLEIPTAFGVGNGTKVQVIDTAVGLRKVRIIETYREIDEDKELKSGWTAMEFVSDK